MSFPLRNPFSGLPVMCILLRYNACSVTPLCSFPSTSTGRFSELRREYALHSDSPTPSPQPLPTRGRQEVILSQLHLPLKGDAFKFHDVIHSRGGEGHPPKHQPRILKDKMEPGPLTQLKDSLLASHIVGTVTSSQRKSPCGSQGPELTARSLRGHCFLCQEGLAASPFPLASPCGIRDRVLFHSGKRAE